MSSIPVRVPLVAREVAPGRTPVYDLTKRAVDVVLSAALLILLFIPLVVVALLIKVDSPGSVLFTQARVGGRRRLRRGGPSGAPHTFRVFKFRSMAANADQSAHEEHIRKYVAGELEGEGEDGEATFKLVADNRVTRVGRVLRRTSLDELPQLINVLRGDMSLVGPRPVPLYEAAQYRDEQLDRFTVPGGVSGLWQVSGRSGVSFQEMIRLDLEYVAHRSIWLDLKIIARTVPTLLGRRGAA
jgi:lipopolysaccharide/colanic/teichoic acid biosynthesis glycosyltransferase